MVVSLDSKSAELPIAAILCKWWFYIKMLHNSFPDTRMSGVLPCFQTQQSCILHLGVDGVGRVKLSSDNTSDLRIPDSVKPIPWQIVSPSGIGLLSVSPDVSWMKLCFIDTSSMWEHIPQQVCYLPVNQQGSQSRPMVRFCVCGLKPSSHISSKR